MVQRIIKLITHSLDNLSGHMFVKRRSLFHEEEIETLPAIEIATRVVNALDITQIGWMCDGCGEISETQDYDGCYPVFRIRGVENES